MVDRSSGSVSNHSLNPPIQAPEFQRMSSTTFPDPDPDRESISEQDARIDDEHATLASPFTTHEEGELDIDSDKHRNTHARNGAVEEQDGFSSEETGKQRSDAQSERQIRVLPSPQQQDEEALAVAKVLQSEQEEDEEPAMAAPSATASRVSPFLQQDEEETANPSHVTSRVAPSVQKEDGQRLTQSSSAMKRAVLSTIASSRFSRSTQQGDKGAATLSRASPPSEKEDATVRKEGVDSVQNEDEERAMPSSSALKRAVLSTMASRVSRSTQQEDEEEAKIRVSAPGQKEEARVSPPGQEKGASVLPSGQKKEARVSPSLENAQDEEEEQESESASAPKQPPSQQSDDPPLEKSSNSEMETSPESNSSQLPLNPNRSPKRNMSASRLSARIRALATFMPLKVNVSPGQSPSGAGGPGSPFTPSAPPAASSNSSMSGSEGRPGSAQDQWHSDPASPSQPSLKVQVSATMARAKVRIQSLADENALAKGEKGLIADWKRSWERRSLKRKHSTSQQSGATLKVWVEALKAMEGQFGSATMRAFAFLRWTFLLNIVLAVLWLGLIILPFWVAPPKAFKWSIFPKAGLTALLQGNGLERTWLFYGGYFYTAGEQQKWYKTDYMYPVAIGAMYLISLLAICWRIAERIKGAGDVSVTYHNMHYPFSTLVFGSWDFHLTNVETAEKLKTGIRMQLRELLADCKAKEDSLPVRRKSFNILLRFVALVVLTPVLFVATVALIASVLGNGVDIKIGSDYGPAVILSLINTAGPMAVRFLVVMEAWKPEKAENMCTVKLFLFRIINAATIFYRLYETLNTAQRVREGTLPNPLCGKTQQCPEGFQCCTGTQTTSFTSSCKPDMDNLCAPGCVEDLIGRQLVRLIVINTLFNCAYESIYGFAYLAFHHGERRQLTVEDMAIDVMYLQALIWVGACFSPLAPLIGLLANLLTFYVMKLVLFRTCAPPERVYNASHTSNLSYALLLSTLILCSIPTSITLSDTRSPICGPVRNSRSMYQVISNYVQRAPNLVWVILQWLANPVILFGVISLLAFLAFILRAQVVRHQHFLRCTRRELEMLRREAHDKVSIIRLQAQLEDANAGERLSPFAGHKKSTVRFPEPLSGSKKAKR